MFDINDKSDCSLFYFGGNLASFAELNNCSFFGSPKYHFIDGKSISKNGGKLIVKNCKFYTNYKKLFNLKRSNEFISINLNEQTFVNSDLNDIKQNNNLLIIFSVSASAFITLVVVVAIVAFLVISKQKHDNIEDEEIQ